MFGHPLGVMLKQSKHVDARLSDLGFIYLSISFMIRYIFAPWIYVIEDEKLQTV